MPTVKSPPAFIIIHDGKGTETWFSLEKWQMGIKRPGFDGNVDMKEALANPECEVTFKGSSVKYGVVCNGEAGEEFKEMGRRAVVNMKANGVEGWESLAEKLNIDGEGNDLDKPKPSWTFEHVDTLMNAIQVARSEHGSFDFSIKTGDIEGLCESYKLLLQENKELQYLRAQEYSRSQK